MNFTICINESPPVRVIIPTPQVVQSRFYIIDIPPVAEGLDGTQGGSKGTGGGEYLTPRIVGILDHFRATGVQDAHNVPLEIVNVGVLGAIELHNRRTVSGIVPEVEGVASLGHVDNVFAVQGVVGHRTVHGFLYPQPFTVVLERRRGAGLAHLLELAALFPGKRPGAVGQGIADGVVSDRRAAVFGQLILPIAVPVSISDRFLHRPDGPGGIGVPLLGQDIPPAVVCIDPGGARCSAGGARGIVRAVADSFEIQQGEKPRESTENKDISEL